MRKIGILLAALLLLPAAWANPITIQNVPAYDWYHGCGPTAAASVLGYWDLNGYPSLFSAAGNDVYLTTNVQNQISSPAHNAKYDPKPDAAGPDPADTSIADFFETSVDPLEYGWSYLSDAPTAFTGYANYRGYDFDAWNATYGAGFDWDDLVAAINDNHPLMFLVDSDGDGGTDHFVSVFGYDDRGAGGQWYASYNTYHEDEATIDWYRFRGMGDPYGVGYATLVDPVTEPTPIPEPATLILAGSGMVWMLRRSRKRS